MKKQQKQFLILLVVLVALVAGLFGLKQYNQTQSKQPIEQEAVITVVAFSSEDIVRFSYDYEGTTYSFVKEEGTWYYAEDKPISLIQTSIADMIAGVALLTAELAIENVTDMTQYGLTEPQRTLRLETEAESVTLLVGDYNSMSDVYYLSKAGDTTVYAVSPAVMEAFERSLEDVTDTTGEGVGDVKESAAVIQ